MNNCLSTLKKRELRAFETAVAAQRETSVAAPLWWPEVLRIHLTECCGFRGGSLLTAANIWDAVAVGRTKSAVGQTCWIPRSAIWQGARTAIARLPVTLPCVSGSHAVFSGNHCYSAMFFLWVIRFNSLVAMATIVDRLCVFFQVRASCAETVLL
jgi:hypothetical protein